MGLAKQVIKLMNEVASAPLAADDVKVGQQVEFVPGHALAGMVGQIANIQSSGNVDVQVGKSIRVDVPISDLLKVGSSFLVDKQADLGAEQPSDSGELDAEEQPE